MERSTPSPTAEADSGLWSLDEINQKFRPMEHLRGWRVKDLDDGYAVDVVRMMTNFRITRTEPGDLTWDRAWCCFGLDLKTLNRTLRAAAAWDGADTTEPVFWNKRLAGPRGTAVEYRDA